jgi:hypothetical protein
MHCAGKKNFTAFHKNLNGIVFAFLVKAFKYVKLLLFGKMLFFMTLSL